MGKKYEICIKVDYKSMQHETDFFEVDTEELEVIKTIIKSAASGSSNYLKIENNNTEIFFPAKVLEKSIIQLTCREIS